MLQAVAKPLIQHQRWSLPWNHPAQVSSDDKLYERPFCGHLLPLDVDQFFSPDAEIVGPREEEIYLPQVEDADAGMSLSKMSSS